MSRSSPMPRPSSGRLDERSAHGDDWIETVPKLLHLRCSPRAGSASSAAADAFLSKFREVRPSWDIDLQDLWRETLPEFDGAALEAKYARVSGRSFSDPERDAFAVVERLAVRFLLADRVLISL